MLRSASEMPNILEVTDPRGRAIHCTDEQWQNHVLGRHSELTGKEQEVSQAVQSPLFICTDADFADREVYFYRKINQTLYLKVVVRFAEDSDVVYVVTPFYADSGKT